MERVSKHCSYCQTKYTVEWDEEKNDLEALTCPFCGYEVEQEDNDIPDEAEHESWN